MASPPVCLPLSSPPPLAGLRTLVLGRGRVGRALAAGLGARGATVSAVAGASSPDPREFDLVVVSVPDDAIAAVIDRLAPGVVAGQVIAHTSGRHGLAVLDPVRRRGASALAFHPAMTFTGLPDDAERLCGARIGITADPGAHAIAERLCAALGATPTWLTDADRALYHAGLTHAANHLVTLIAESQALLVRAGVDDPSAVLRPLVTAALAGVLERGVFATSGPVVRGDAGTVGDHLRVLAAEAPEVLPSYRALAASTARLAAADGRLGDTSAARMAAVLETVSA